MKSRLIATISLAALTAQTLVIVALMAASPASAATSCISTFGHDPVQTSSATAFWEQNAAVHHGCGYTGWTRIHCVANGGGPYVIENGGHVVAEQLDDTARCPTDKPNVIKAGWMEALPSGNTPFWFYTAAAAHTTAIQVHRCSRILPVTHSANLVQMYAQQTCGNSYRAWGDWQIGFHYGTYRSTNGDYSVACAIPSNCGSGGGTLFDGGYQVKANGNMVCTFSCANAYKIPWQVRAMKRGQLTLAS